MADSSVSAIDDKNDSKSTDANGTEPDWGKFGKSILFIFIGILLFTLLGSNFIFYLNSDKLDTIFNTDMPIEINKSVGGGYKCVKNHVDRPPIKVDITGFPYTSHTGNNSEPLSGKGFVNWFALTVANTFIFFRTGIKACFNSNLSTLPDMLNYIIAVFLFIILSIVVPIGAFLTTHIRCFINDTNKTWVYALFGLFFQINTIIAIGNAIIQSITFQYYFLLQPLLMDATELREISGCNVDKLSLLFGMFCIFPAFNSLGNTYGLVMAATWFILFLKHLFGGKKQT